MREGIRLYFFGDTYFHAPVLKNIFQIIFSIVLIMEFIILISTALKSHTTPGMKSKSDRGSMLLIIVGYCLAILLNPFLIHLFPFVVPEFIFWIGMLLAVIGIFIRIYSVWTLRHYFSPTVQVSSEQKIVQTGPYKYIRHPAYTGSILALLGISISFRSPLGIIANLLIIAVIYGYRIKIEEKAMEKSFGLLYENYKKHTWRLIPHIW